jgi:transcriptional regulator with XRE-family HTH domain
MTASLHFVALAGQRDVEYRSSDGLGFLMPDSDASQPAAENEFAAIGARVRLAREEAGFTLATASEALAARGHKITDKGLGHWETGARQLDAVWLRRLALLYGVSVESFYSDTRVTADEVRLAAAFKALVLKNSPAPSPPPEGIGSIRSIDSGRRSGTS